MSEKNFKTENIGNLEVKERKKESKKDLERVGKQISHVFLGRIYFKSF